MNTLKTKSFKMVVLTIIILLLMGAFRYVTIHDPVMDSIRYLTLYLVYITMLAFWAVSVWNRIMHSHIKFYLMSIASLLFLWIFFRSIKNGYFGVPDSGQRFLWYCYYIPMILIPLFSYYTSLALGKTERWRPNSLYLLLLVPAFLLIIFVLTNDLHQMVFSFEENLMGWDGDYAYKLPYYIILLWITVFFILSVALLIKKSYIPYTGKLVWLPLFLIVLGIVYTGLYMLDNSKNGVGFIEMTVMYSALTVGIWESCMQTGLIPSNTKHRDFINASSLGIQITEPKGKVYFTSQLSKPIDSETFEKIKEEEKIQINSDTMLHSWPIKGGYVLWQEDISQLTALINQLQDTGAELKDGVDILKGEIETKTRRLRIEEQNRIYDLTFRQILPQLQKINNNILLAKTADKKDKIQLLKEINLIGVHIKRKGNLVLMAEGEEPITFHDLSSYFNEAFENLSQWGIKSSLALNVKGEINIETALLFYDLFSDTIEAALTSLKVVFVVIRERGEYLVLSIQIESDAPAGDLPGEKWQKDRLNFMGGNLITETGKDNTYYIALHLPKGGGAE